MNPFLRYLADKKSAHRQTDRHTPMTTRACGLRRAGKHINISRGARVDVPPDDGGRTGSNSSNGSCRISSAAASAIPFDRWLKGGYSEGPDFAVNVSPRTTKFGKVVLG